MTTQKLREKFAPNANAKNAVFIHGLDAFTNDGFEENLLKLQKLLNTQVEIFP